jgi:hypothetical protein
MFPGIHDSYVVAYSADARSEQVVLTIRAAAESADGEFRIVFEGVAAHQFRYPQIPSIVDDLIEVPVETLLEQEAEALSEGSRQCGWPGAWFTSRQAALAYCESAGLRAFELQQSYGLSGWVLARSVARVGGGI